MNGEGEAFGPRDVFALLGLRPPGSSSTAGGAPERDQWSGGTHGQILLVEDDRSIRDVLCGILEEEGYAVTIAEDGRRALDHLRSGGMPDLIILDLRMPIMDGWQFRAAQKADPVLATIPVLAISADGSAKAAAIDAAFYIRKPLSTGALIDAIRSILADAERKRILGRLEEAERFAALGRLAASVGHEINNPLTFVSMNLDLVAIQVKRHLGDVLGAAKDLADVQIMLKECRVGVDRIRDIVKDLQRLSGKPEVTREAFSLNTLVDESLAMAGSNVLRGATVHKEYADLPMVVGDRSALGQVLLNLIFNAAQALPTGSAESNHITLRTLVSDGAVIVEVGDTGRGIPPEVLPHIFDPFYTTKSPRDVTGLGLTVSYRIVSDHGGHIDVDSEEGKGSLFRVILPVGGPPLTVAVPSTKPGPDSGPGAGRILIIDDLTTILRAITDALPEHDVTVVAKASEAFARFASNETFDVILCDLMMPHIGARDVLERLERDWPHLAGRLIFMTNGAFTAEALEFLQRTKQRVLVKPFSVDELRVTILMHLQERICERN